MRIDQGLMAGQVLQRKGRNTASVRVEGVCSVEGRVEGRVLKGRTVLSGLNWRAAGKASAGRFVARLTGIPCGGPYAIEWRVGNGNPSEARARVADIWVGDVWFLAGQSNMQGVGLMASAPPSRPEVRCFYMREEWGDAREPLHLLAEAVDPVHHPGPPLSAEAAAAERRRALRGVGPGVFFGLEMFRYTGVPQGLVACAHGGTSMEAWSPAEKRKRGASLYGAMCRRFRRLGQPIRGMLWYQGESDAFPAPAEVYTSRMKKLVAAVRRDFRQPHLPWITVQIGRVYSETWQAGPWNSIQDQQRLLPARIPNFETVPAHDLEMDDMIHIGSRGQAILAERMARLAKRLAFGDHQEPGSIRLADVEECADSEPHVPAPYRIELRFDNVVGRLRSAGCPNGFYLLDSSGNVLPAIYKVRLEGCRAILELTLPPALVFKFGYGWGCTPFCNLTDDRGLPVPIFGPLLMSGHRGSAFLVHWVVSGPYPDRDVQNCGCPGHDASWRAPHSVATHLIMPQDVRNSRPGLFYFRTRVDVKSDMDVKMAMGADSPYRVWINGNGVAEDLTATNPCVPDKTAHPVHLRAGMNEIVVAFDGRNGMGWGLCMRFLPLNRRQIFPAAAVTEHA